jgi:exonuclease III
MDEAVEAALMQAGHQISVLAANERRLIDELRQAKKDAERYRWLRSTTNWASSNGERVDVRNNPALWDEAIDACIAKAAAVGAA